MQNDINTTLEEFARKYLSPSQKERDAVSFRYQQLLELLPGNDIFQSGSFKRETTVSPVHDLDVIWVMPSTWQSTIIQAYSKSSSQEPFTFDVSQPLSELSNLLRQQYAKKGEKVTIEEQGHSVRISFEKEVFSIDVVPAVKSGRKNVYQDDIYLVPEIQKIRHKKWAQIYKQREGKLRWILSDPKFYIKEAERLNQNPSYRKAVKFVKTWRRACNAGLIDFELQSFHLELVMAHIFTKDTKLNLYKAVNQFLNALPVWIATPQIRDVANPSVFVDSYLNDDVQGLQRARVIKFVQATLAIFSGMNDEMDFDQAYTTIRNCTIAPTPWLTNGQTTIVNIACTVERVKKWVNRNGYHPSNLPKTTLMHINGPRPLRSDEEVKRGYKLIFEPIVTGLDFDAVKWLVVNTGTDALEKHRIGGWRGFEFQECDTGTQHREERTEYIGRHWIDCYLLKGGHCVGAGRFYVNIKPG